MARLVAYRVKKGRASRFGLVRPFFSSVMHSRLFAHVEHDGFGDSEVKALVVRIGIGVHHLAEIEVVGIRFAIHPFDGYLEVRNLCDIARLRDEEGTSDFVV